MEKILKDSLFNINKSIDLFVEQNNRMATPLKTDFEFLKYIDEGRLIVLGGDSGIGKTTYVLQILYNLVKDNQNREDSVIGLYVSNRTKIDDLIMRLIVNQQVFENVDITHIKKKFNQNIPFYFLDESRFNLKNIMEFIRTTRKENPNKRIFIAIDYLQPLLDLKAIKQLKECLIENKANAIAISALNKDAIKNNCIDIIAFDDEIEYIVDVAILFTFKNNKGKYTLKINNKQKEQNFLEMYAYCVKNRTGKTFIEKMHFDKLKQHFKIMKQ